VNVLETFFLNNNPQLKKFLKIAKGVKDSEDPCLSRSIGTIIVDPVTEQCVSTGHNGPPMGLPACDSRDHLENVVWPQLSASEKAISFGDIDAFQCGEESNKKEFLDRFEGCGKCPRRIIGAKSGDRLELCTCAHSEANAVVKAGRRLAGFWMFAYCGVPCQDCCKAIIESGIKVVVCFEKSPPGSTFEQKRKNDYSYSSRWMLSRAGIEVFTVREEELSRT
jgi:deoxycytidylate deaminase